MELCVGGSSGAMQNYPRDESEVSIECVQSSEFVIGKQANFNGAVTIINCADAGTKEGGEEGKTEGREEKIIIRDKVLAPGARPQEKTRFEGLRQKLEQWRVGRKKVAVLATCVVVCIGVASAAAVGLAVLVQESSGGGSERHPMYSKEDWLGKPATSVVKMKLPVPYVVVSHTVTPLCRGLEACAVLIRNMQQYHLDLKFADISYNFLVDSEGSIYEGRGWERRNVKGGFVNGRNIDIALIGDYSETIVPTPDLMDGLKYLLDLGLALNKTSPTYSLIASNSTYPTLSPGKNVYSIIKDWPHFDPNPKAHINGFQRR